jgi:hypothetical protein
MPIQTVRPTSRDPREPVHHQLDPIRIDGQSVQLYLTLRRDEDGAWRGRLRYVEAESGQERATAEILCGMSEADVWESVRDLRDHHLRDLYRSLA